ncbi:hypothetical protein BRC62_01260 [Halobacteriales archaeon QH_10_67_13]|nr:MAG: hypothetical protein BRC62_01260 [Halobacteriales archaeon QH_10_67_13]
MSPRSSRIELPCGQRVDPHRFDLGAAEYACPCGDAHAVVTDADSLDRFVPPEVVNALRATVEPADELENFATPHVLAMVQEESPDRIASADLADAGQVGYARLWVADFSDRRLHEVLVELMDHALSHADDEAADRFERQLATFAAAFVDAYRD